MYYRTDESQTEYIGGCAYTMTYNNQCGTSKSVRANASGTDRSGISRSWSCDISVPVGSGSVDGFCYSDIGDVKRTSVSISGGASGNC